MTEQPLALHLGDCLEVLRTLPDASVDAVVTDPPYGLAFMGKRWDYDVPTVEVWAECLRVLKPGGHLLAFAGTRTQHRMAVRIEDAGFEIRDLIMYCYGSGFPKSLDISKAIDRAAGAEREVVGNKLGQPGYSAKPADEGNCYGDGLSNGEAKCLITAPATPEAQQWAGWGTALKPALEPITVARKPLDGTVAANVLAHGTGGINVDGCRVNPGEPVPGGGGGKLSGRSCGILGSPTAGNLSEPHTSGRWPANLIHDGSDEVVGLFTDSEARPARAVLCGGVSGTGGGDGNIYGKGLNQGARTGYADKEKSAARFFYTAKASRQDRGDGNNHPTVKPTDLMRYLCRLVTPPNGIVLDPFMGSGSTGKAALLEGFRFIGIERDPAYHAIAERRIGQASATGYQPSLLGVA